MLPKNLRFQGKVESSSARSYKANIQPQNGTGPYNLGDTIILNIPTNHNLCISTLDSYLKFNVMAQTSTGAGNVLRFDSCGAHGLIQRIRVFSGSNLIEDQDSYGALAKLLFDIQQPTDSIYGKQNMLAGCRNDLVTFIPSTSSQALAGDYSTGFADAAHLVTGLNVSLARLENPISCLQVNSGESLRNATTASISPQLAAAEVTTVQTYCINLISIMGALCSQNYFPLWACTSAPIRIEIQLVSQLYYGMNCISAITNSGLINNVEYVAEMMELSDEAMSMVQSSLGGQPLQFVVPSFRNYQFTATLGTSATSISMPVPAKFSSVKGLYMLQRANGSGALTYYPFSSTTMGITDYTFRVGSQVMPPKAPSTLCEMFAELMKSIDSLGNINHQPSIEKTSYSQSSNTANTVTLETNNATTCGSGSFYVGINLENYASASKDSIYSGFNTNTSDIYYLANFAAQGSATSTRFDCFANFDLLVVCDNSTCYVKF